MTDEEIAAWAERFWRRAGRTEPFPRSLEPTVAWVLPLAVVKLPRLGLSNLSSWLTQRGILLQCTATDRRLRACLVAKAGYGVIFLDGSDPDDEQRFSLAHEVVHFLSDYLEPRERALALLGETGRDVLDGRRVPTMEERLRGMLRGVELGTYTHLMDRSLAGDVERLQVLAVEDRADRLALELLAPRSTVLAHLERQHVVWRNPSAFVAAQETLMQQFGLPAPVAERYGKMLVWSRRPARTFREWLGT